MEEIITFPPDTKARFQAKAREIWEELHADDEKKKED